MGTVTPDKLYHAKRRFRMIVYLQILFAFMSGYVVVSGILSGNDGNVKHLGLLGLLLLLLYFPTIELYSRTLEWHMHDRLLWELYKNNIIWITLGGVLSIIQITVSDEYITSFLGRFKDDTNIKHSKVHKAPMGASSSNFNDKSLDIQSTAIVKLTHAAFGHLDRQVSASIEANLNVKPNQRKNVQRLLAEVIDQKPSIADALRPLKRMQQGGHNTAYGIFDKMCMIAAHSQRYSQGSLNNLISIAQQLGLSQEEIYYLFQKSRLAV